MIITGSLIISKSLGDNVLTTVGGIALSGSTISISGSRVAFSASSGVSFNGASVVISSPSIVLKGQTVDLSQAATLTLGSNVTATPSAHSHAGGDITSGIVAAAYGGTGLDLGATSIATVRHYYIPCVTPTGSAGTSLPTEGVPPFVYRPSGVLISGSTALSSDWKMTVNDVKVNPNYTVYVNGTLGVKDTITEMSTRAIKTNIIELGDELSKIKQLIPVEFDYIDTNRHSIGFIAEEFANTYPDLVANDENGEPNSIAYSNLVSPLVKAIQQLSEKLDELTRRVEALENK